MLLGEGLVISEVYAGYGALDILHKSTHNSRLQVSLQILLIDISRTICLEFKLGLDYAISPSFLPS